MVELLKFLDSAFMPKSMAIGDPAVIIQHVIGNTLISIGFGLMGALILRFVLDSGFVSNRLLGWFGAFLSLCGLSRLLNIVVLYYPVYVLQGWLDIATGVVSLIAFVKLGTYLPAIHRKYDLQMQNFLLVREVSHLAANQERDILKAVQLRSLIRQLSLYADAVDAEID